MLLAQACTTMFYIVTSLAKLTANLVWFEATSTFQYFQMVQMVPGVHSSFVVSLGNQSFSTTPDGAELLLDLGLPAALIGGVVLPFLGAVPDSAMIIASGAAGNRTEANHKIAVGMG